jgi:signal transduction histidine kinase
MGLSASASARAHLAHIGAASQLNCGFRLRVSTGPPVPVLRHDERMTPLAGRVLTAAATGVTGIGVTLGIIDHDDATTAVCLGALVAIAIGWVVVRKEPKSAVGPALAWSGAAVALVLSVEILAQSAYTPSPRPLADVVRPIWVGIWSLHLAGVLVLLLVFPDGRPLSRRWLAVPVAYLAGTVVMVLGSWGAREVHGQVVGGADGPAATAADVVGIAVIGSCLVLAVVSLVLRYRRGQDQRRVQLRWLMLAAVATVAVLMLGWAAQAFGAPLAVAYTPFLVGVVVLMPSAVGIAIVRHDLFDVDRLLSATTAWILTLVGSAAVFAAVVLVVSRVLDERSGLAATAAAFVTALTLLPLQRHVTAATGRFIDHDRFVAVAEVEAFAAEVRNGQRAPEEIEEVLRSAQRDPELRLYLARPEGFWSDLSGTEVVTPGGLAVQANGAVIARIVLGHDSARARRRVGQLARAGWVPIEVSRLRLALRDALAEVEASRARLAEVTAEERKRLERDLHDGVQSRLVATGMRLRSLQRHGLDGDQSEEVDAAVGELEATVTEIRRLAHGVRPIRLDDGLGAALASLGEDSPVPIDLKVGELPELDDTRTLTAYYVVSEAVANALKHARATKIEVGIRAADGQLLVEVYDDGVGGVSPLGLTGLRDRVSSLDGRLGIDSVPGIGTTIRAVL